MPSKIFISYRREDSAANALGICQYLEHQFGRKNVFIDVDMRAGTKFPAVLEQRLAECKVLLALIGPDWLSARDERGNRRLDNPDDWVRLEIAHALRRNITVIPVRVNGAALPGREALPDEIRGLLDHQAVSATTTGFRHEMAGLARDIRAMPNAHPWRRVAAAATAASMLAILVAFALVYRFGLTKPAEAPNAQASPSAKQNAIWTSKPGQWVAFASGPMVYYLDPTSVKRLGDKLFFTERFPLKLINVTLPSEETAVYEDDEVVLDCKQPKWLQAEISYYNRAGEVISHFKRGNPSSLDLSSIGQPFNPNTIIATAQHLLCNEQLRTPLLTKKQLLDMKLQYLAPTPTGDGDFFRGPTEPLADPNFSLASLFVMKLHQDKSLASIFPAQTILGFPASYRTEADRLQVDCRARKQQLAKAEYYDTNNNLIDVYVPFDPPLLDVKEGTPMAFLFDLICPASGASVAGTYEGTNTATYKSVGAGEQKISIHVTQNGSDVTISFQTPNGRQGTGTGKLTGDTVSSLTLKSTAPGCPGSYEGSLKFEGDTMSWSYEGKDCGGQMNGRGTAKRTKG